MTPAAQFDYSAYEKMETEKLERVVNDAVMAISNKTSLSNSEVLEILENMRVELVGEISHALDSMGNLAAVKRTDTAKLSMAIEEAIEKIANATDLDTAEISRIFTDEPGASVGNVAHRLHVTSSIHRESDS